MTDSSNINQEDKEKNFESTIQRANHHSQFFSCERQAMQNKELSLQAKGLLGILLSFSDNFTIYKDSLCQFSKNGRDGTRAAFDELINAKYIYKHEYLNDRSLKRIKYYLYETPYDEKSDGFKKRFPYAENPRAVSKRADKPRLNNTYINNTYINNTNKEDAPKVASTDSYKIKLTEEEKEKLIKEIGEDETNEYIEKLLLYLKSIGKPQRYKCHYSTILSWYRRDNKKKRITSWSEKEDKKLMIGHKIYKFWYVNETRDPALINMGFLDIKEKTLQDSRGGPNYKKNFDEFIRIIQERYHAPYHLIERINKKTAEVAQISTISKNIAYGIPQTKIGCLGGLKNGL